MDNRKILWLVISAMGLVILVSGIYIADLQQQLTELRQSTPETVIISDQPVEVNPQKTNIQVNNFLPQGDKLQQGVTKKRKNKALTSKFSK